MRQREPARVIVADHPTGPGTLAPGATAQVRIPLMVTGETPAIGRALLRASSNRSHGPFLLALDRPD